jgi:hypothetical protein
MINPFIRLSILVFSTFFVIMRPTSFGLDKDMIFTFGTLLALYTTLKTFKTYHHLWQLCAILLWSGLLCLFIGEAGTYIDANELVHEAGFILPIGALLVCTGTVGTAFMSFRKK